MSRKNFENHHLSVLLIARQKKEIQDLWGMVDKGNDLDQTELETMRKRLGNVAGTRLDVPTTRARSGSFDPPLKMANPDTQEYQKHAVPQGWVQCLCSTFVLHSIYLRITPKLMTFPKV